MRIWRALIVPFDLAALFFVVICALLLMLLSASGIIAMIPIIMLLSWLFKYGFAILEHVAHGQSDAPVFSHELLGPFDARPWVQAAMCAAAFLLTRYLEPAAGRLVTVGACLILPAWIAVLGTSDHLYQAFNPLALWRMLRGLGAYYLIVLLLIGAAALIFVSVNLVPLWLTVRYALMELCILACYSVIGEAIYARRLELGFAARSSPERKQDREVQERDNLRQQAIDGIYAAVNSRQYVEASARLESWLATVAMAHIGEDAQTITAATVLWRNDPGAMVVLQALVAWLLGKSRSVDAVEVTRSALIRLPAFALPTEPATLALAEAARSLGQPRFAFKVLENFAQHYPQIALSTRALELRAECTP
jgi:hypothetical protein